ncbi:hypothetical protein M422DRAFT_238305 [Sphaerobolus stellatus SS14]|nr:hypothetical protein M422DRAFT_238305 [Sphaerobolus stellatus SS14]
MGGKKTGDTSKSSSGSKALSRQVNLFHYYKKETKPVVQGKASTSEIQKDVAPTKIDTRPLVQDASKDVTPILETSEQKIELKQEVQRVQGRYKDSDITTPSQTHNIEETEDSTSNAPTTAQLPTQDPLKTKFWTVFQRQTTPSSSSSISQTGAHDKQVPETQPSVPIPLPDKALDYAKQAEAPSNIIDLTDSPVRKQLPVHDLTTPAEKRPNIVINVDTLTLDLPGSQDKPINLTDSPIQVQRPPKTLHPFFANHTSPIKKHDRDVKNEVSRNFKHPQKPIDAPWPNAACQHVKGPLSTFLSPDPPSFAKSDRHFNVPPIFSAKPPIIARQSRAESPTGRTSNPLDRDTIIKSMPDDHRNHPGISRFLNGNNFEATETEIWTRKWRPRRAVEVLGNDNHALYMRAWLQALAVRPPADSQILESKTTEEPSNPKKSRGLKRPQIIRSVAKKPARKRRRIDSDEESDGWIVGDDEEESGGSASEDNASLDRSLGSSARSEVPFRLRGMSKPPGRGLSEISTPIPNFETLTNTILLAGPSGSGKTCAVYACAEELGWEVFEVYPGIGKRSGAGISSLIGDVGKNHLVRKRVINGLHTRNYHDECNRGNIGRNGEKKASSSYDDGNSVQQSIILLEEVDIVFKEDANFWPTIVNFIKTSRRPVIMTCNDIALIPYDELPFQTCLNFQPCPIPLAASFLQSACMAEGRLFSREQLEAIYEKPYSLISCDEPDDPSLPFPSQAPPCPDLRRAINQLQFWTSAVAEDGTDVDIGYGETTPALTDERVADWSFGYGEGAAQSSVVDESPAAAEYDIFLIGKHIEYSSYTDAYLERHPADILEAFAIDRYEPSSDDEVSYTLLEKPPSHTNGLPFYNWDAEIAHAAISLSRHVLEASGAGKRSREEFGERGGTRHFNSRSLMEARVANQLRAVSFLDDTISLFGPLLPRPAAVLDYTPYVRQMVLADDAMAREFEAQPQETVGRRGRRSRWRAGEYVRYLDVSSEGRTGARNLLFSE